MNTYRDNKLFNALLKDDFTAYLAKCTESNAKNIFKISKIEGILTAYKFSMLVAQELERILLLSLKKLKLINLRMNLGQNWLL